MRIAHFCEFADRTCGVFRAVLEIAKRQIGREQDVTIFTTHFMKDYSINNKEEVIEGIKCIKIKATKLGGEGFNYWKKTDFSEFDKLYSHVYRKHHNLFLAKYESKKILVTHAPWGSNSMTRSFLTFIFDSLYGSLIRKNFEIYHIANWEKQSTLFKDDFKTIEIPLREEFLSLPRQAEQQNKILYVGRKDKIQPFLDNTELDITIVTNIFDVNELIKLYDGHRCFLLVSIREGLPTVLREAKQRGCITIATKNKGTEEVGADYLFDYGDWQGIDELLKSAESKQKEKEVKNG